MRDERQRWLQKQVDEPLVEPNSALGKALSSRHTHWDTLTRFVSIPGAPLDNNLVERALKLCIRQRKNSLFYRTEHRAEVCADPAAWLPWTYHTALASPSATRRQARAIWARSGSPFHSTMSHSRADTGTRASAVV